MGQVEWQPDGEEGAVYGEPGGGGGEQGGAGGLGVPVLVVGSQVILSGFGGDEDGFADGLWAIVEFVQGDEHLYACVFEEHFGLLLSY